MGNFRSDGRNSRDDRGFGRSSGRFGGRSGGFRDRGGFGRDRDRRPVEMHDVVCDKCKKPCQVPFKPTGDKPVYCSDCFKQNGNPRSSSSGISSEQLDKINAKLDMIIKALKIEVESESEDNSEDELELGDEDEEESE